MHSNVRGPLGTGAALLIGLSLLTHVPAVAAQPCALEATQRLTPADGLAGDQFGGMSSTFATSSVSMHEDLIVVGAPYRDDDGSDAGAAYLFRFNGVTWQLEAVLHAADAAAGDHFGAAVCVRADVAIVGAPGNDHAGNDSGAAYVFRRGPLGWSDEAKLTPTEATADDQFGYAVAADGGIIVIGAPHLGGGGGESGSAYVFGYDGQQWRQASVLASDTPTSGDHFGVSLAIDGDLIAAGAPGTTTGPGAAFLFRETGGAWEREITLDPNEAGLMPERFGNAVALSGQVAAVGACNVPEFGRDVVFVFRYAQGRWCNEAVLSDERATDWMRFGRSVSIEADALVVGADLNSEAGTYLGAAYLYRRIDGEWRSAARLGPTEVADGSMFGHAVGISGPWAIVAAPRDDPAGDDSGSVCVYRWLVDCGASGIVGPCELADGASADCNGNGVPDACDIASGTSQDRDADGQPDECASSNDDDPNSPGGHDPNDADGNNADNDGDIPGGSGIACGAGACGAGPLSWFPLTLVALGWLRFCARAGCHGQGPR